ncbi:RDD family protein [Streptomyces triculaminicus]|uniref:RDD family protein n=2 Tax=Streptomyces TaxID=1883 RepID=A0A939FKR8_9ACTN|nr:RDD family protein [Streptomyces triculaminicus]MBO0651610.1 RDD family protein [Streptomyces triculaminicus]
MSTEPPPDADDNDPFKKQQPPPGPPPPYPGSGGGSPYGGGPGGGAPGGGGPYGGGPYGGGSENPYGGRNGAADPLAGMPPLASRFKRLIARIIDAFIVGIPVSVVFWLATWGYDPWRDTSKNTGLSILISLVYFLYEGLMLTTRGQTLGKMAMQIRVAMLDNGAIPEGRPGWTRAAVYSLPEIVPCCGFVFWLLNVLWCTWDEPYHQCIHDKAAKTVVVSTVQ